MRGFPGDVAIRPDSRKGSRRAVATYLLLFMAAEFDGDAPTMGRLSIDGVKSSIESPSPSNLATAIGFWSCRSEEPVS
jgi:hypothetical protein